MFYKFKINYNRSEFSLSCLDKDIIEREMDLYFAFFADAGEDFISKIKEIEVAHPKIKKIDEMVSSAIIDKVEITDETIESVINDNVVQQNVVFSNDKADQIHRNENQTDVLKISDAFNSVFDEKNEEKIEGIYSIKQIVQEEPDSQLIEHQDNISNEVDVKQSLKIDDITSEFGFDNSEPEVSQRYGEIQDMIKLAQSKIEADDLKNQIKIENEVSDASGEYSDDDKQVELVDSDEVIEKNLLQHFVQEDDCNNFENQDNKKEPVKTIDNVSEKNNKELLDDIFSNNIKDDKFSEELKNKIENLEIKETHKVQAVKNDTVEETYDDLVFKSNKTNEFLNLQNETPSFQIQQPTEAELLEFAQNLDNAIQQSIQQESGNSQISDVREINLIDGSNKPQEDVESGQYAPEIPVFNDIPMLEEVSDEKVNASLKEQFNPMGPIDFPSFLSIFRPSSINDEFLICAYYIKNILNEQSFTMKSVNAKLFKASGKIAGISVLEDLIEIGLIEQLQGQNINLYTISSEGEKYFEDKFQR